MSRLTATELRTGAIAAVALAAVACLPLFEDGYYLSLALNIVMYAALCTAWSLFSGPTHYVSLATAAFFGVGTYAVGLGIDHWPFWLLCLTGASVGAVLAMLVGLATLRLSGVYFVIFTLGLAELVRQLVTWWQTNFTTGIGLYVLTDFGEREIFWMLLGLMAVIFVTGWAINRSRLGFAMRIIGDDEQVAAHVGIDTARAKVILFIVSGAFIALVGAIVAPRFAYIEPPSAFNPMISFQVVIMALLGGTRRLWGPLVGVIPFTILFDFVQAQFPNQTNLVIGLTFMAIVYLIPRGITGLLEGASARLSRLRTPAPARPHSEEEKTA